MSLESPPAAPAKPLSARPPTDLNPKAQPGPKAPPTSAPPTTAAPAKAPPSGPDLSKVPPTRVDPSQAIKALYAEKKSEAPAPPATAKPPVEAPVYPAGDLKNGPPGKDGPIGVEGVPASFMDMAPPEKLSENAAKAWDNFKSKAKSEVDAAKKALTDAQAELGTLKKATPAEAHEIERLKAEHKAALDQLAVTSLEHHPDFIRQFGEPKKKALAEAATLLTDNGITDAVDFNALLAKSRPEFAKAVSELTGKMQDFDKASFATAMRDAYRLTGEAKEQLKNAGEVKAGIESKTVAQQKQAFEETWGKFGGAENFLKPAEIPDAASPEEKQALYEYNQAIQNVRPEAEKNAFGRVDPKAASVIASKAAVLDFVVKVAVPRMEKEYSQLKTDYAAMAAELQAIKAAKTHTGFESTPGSDGAPPPNTPWQQQLKNLYKK